MQNDGYNILKGLFSTIKIEDIMTKPVSTVNEDDDLSDVVMIFLTQRVSHVCVIDANKKLVGMISQKYLYKTRSPQKILPGENVEFDKDTIVVGDSFYDRRTLDGYILKEVMDKVVSTLRPDDSLKDAILAMSRMNVDCIPITKKDYQVCGLVNESDIIKFMANILGL